MHQTKVTGNAAGLDELSPEIRGFMWCSVGGFLRDEVSDFDDQNIRDHLLGFWV